MIRARHGVQIRARQYGHICTWWSYSIVESSTAGIEVMGHFHPYFVIPILVSAAPKQPTIGLRAF